MKTQAEMLQDAQERLRAAEAEIQSLRGQKKGLVFINRYLRQRPDLPVDRIDAAKRALAEITHLRGALVGAFDALHAGLNSSKRSLAIAREYMWKASSIIATTDAVGAPPVDYGVPPADKEDHAHEDGGH